jgi:hypothetical protein
MNEIEEQELWIPLIDLLSDLRSRTIFFKEKETKLFSKDEVLALVKDLIDYCKEKFEYRTTAENPSLLPLSALSLESIVINISKFPKNGNGSGKREKQGRLFELRIKKRMKLVMSTACTASTAAIVAANSTLSMTAAGDHEERKDRNQEVHMNHREFEEEVEEVDIESLQTNCNFARARNEYEDLFVKKLTYFLLQLMKMEVNEKKEEMDKVLEEKQSEEELIQKFREMLGTIDRNKREYREVMKQQDFIVGETMGYALDKVGKHSLGLSLGWLQSQLSLHLTGNQNEMLMYLKQRLQEVYVMRCEQQVM